MDLWTWEWAAFLPLAAIAIAGGWMVFRFDSMARATLSLLTSFLAVSLILLLLASPFLAFITFLMMIFEMMIMLLFMIAFMMNPAGLNPMQMVHQPKLAAGAGIALFVVLAAAILTADFPDRRGTPPDDVTAALGFELMGPSMLIFETAGVTLLTGMIAVIAIAARRGRFGDAIRVEKGGETGGGHGHHHGHGGHG
jgi:NADH:ubiquinone oxidoreductase subunit 6 (subunit J)